jgi:GT2 family glycosyltransferase
MKISVVIATMNRSSDLEKLMASLMAQTRLPDEVLIVDQSTDGMTRKVAEDVRASHAGKPFQLRYLVQEEKSLVKARNVGLSEAMGDIITFFDDDVVLFEDYMELVERRFENDVTLGALSGNVVLPERLSGWKWRLRQALMRFFLVSRFDGRMTASGFGYPIYEREIEHPMYVEMLPGCNMSYRKEAIQGERFDEWFTGYGYREDADFSYRVSQWTQVMMVPEARLYHHHSPANRLDDGALKRMMIRNYHHVFQKYRSQGAFSRLLFAWSLLGLALIDLLEFLSTRRGQKFRNFTASMRSILSLPHGAAAQPIKS